MTAVSGCIVARVACTPFGSLEPFAAPPLVAAVWALDAADAAWEAARDRLEQRLHELAGPPGGDEAAARARFAILAVRRAVHRGAPPSPEELAALPGAGPPEARLVSDAAGALGQRGRAIEQLERALEGADRTSATALNALIQDPAFEEGLDLASAELHAAALRLVSTPWERWRARERQVAATVLQYAVRAATKTSPHGVFCATALAGWGERSRLSGRARPARILARVNVSEARKLTAPLERELARRPGARLVLNPSLVERGEAVDFWHPAADDPELELRRKVRRGPALDALLEFVRGVEAGGLDRASLLAWMEAQVGGAAPAWLDRLLESGLLVTRSAAPHDEPRPLRWSARAAGSAPGTGGVFDAVERGLDTLADEPAPLARMAIYRSTRAALAALPTGAPLDGDALLRVDAVADIEVTLARSCARELERAVPQYARLFAALYPRELLLAPYVQRFRAHHPADHDVPLVDVYHGVFDGLGSGTRVAFPDPGRVAPGATGPAFARALAARARWQSFLDERCDAAESAGAREIRIDDADWAHLAGDTPPPRFACGILFQCAGGGEPGSAERMVWNAIYGAGLASARLADLHRGDSPSDAGPLATELRDGWSWLAPPGAIVAEIPFRHSGRTANAGLKPRVFEHEIELPGEVPSPGASTIPLSDLVLRFDGSAGRFVLRSRLKDRIIVPVLTNGLSPEGFIAFLAAVGQQDAQPLAWFQDADPRRPGHAPRVTSGATVLFRERWRLEPAEADRLLGPGASAAQRFARVQRWRPEAGACRFVFASSDRSPKPFHVDLESPWSIDALARIARDGSTLVLREMNPVPAPDAHAIEYLAHVRCDGGTP